MLNLSPHDGMSQHLIIRTPGSWLPTSMTQCWPVVCPLVSTTDGTGATAGWLGMIIYVIYVILIHLIYKLIFFGLSGTEIRSSDQNSEFSSIQVGLIQRNPGGFHRHGKVPNSWMVCSWKMDDLGGTSIFVFYI